MNKTIYKYLFNEFVRYFVATLFALAAIVWAVQAVNFLDLITEDGHAFTVYFGYSFLTLSKVLTKLIPFCFLIATILTIIKLEKDNINSKLLGLSNGRENIRCNTSQEDIEKGKSWLTSY